MESGRFREDGVLPDSVEDILRRKLVTVTKLGRKGSITTAPYYSESGRLLTYEDGFKSDYMTAISCAKAGLINHRRGPDSVACPWCQVLFCKFKASIDAIALHLAYAEQICEFIQNYTRCNIPLAVSTPSDLYESLSLAHSFRGISDMSQTLDTGSALAMTLNSTHNAVEELTERSPPQNDRVIADRYIQFENRNESLMTPNSMRAVMVNDPHTMRYEQMRLTSFLRKGWANFYAEHLAMAGFYLEKEMTGKFTIACPFCDGKITDVPKDTIPMFTKEKDHTPLQVHILKFPACAFIQGIDLGTRGNVPMTAGEFRWNQSKVVTTAQANVGSELVTMGVATTQAGCPPMAVYERRFDSFLTLPYDHPKGAEELAACGFYNLGNEGNTKCFWCGVECGSWSSGEDVWVRHARSMRSCQFVINEKGAEFVNHVIEEHGEWIDSQRDEDRIRNFTTRMILPRMDAPVVQTVICMGYTRDHVKTAIINRLKKLKPDYTSTADLVSDVLALINRDMTYHRDLKLPDVPVSPKATISETEERDADDPSLADIEAGAAIENLSDVDERVNPEDNHSDAQDANYDGDRYRISSNRQVGLVVPNPIDRDGYVAESNAMDEALRCAGFDVIRVEWTNQSELMNAIVNRIRATSSQCDVFLVFISSHGNIGHMKCSDGSVVAINDILHTISSNLPKHIPLVVIIQACMGFTCEAMTVPGTDPAEYTNTNTKVNRHVEATRPHTVVLWATVNGRSAVRGAYPKALATQIRGANNCTSIHDMHLAACRELEKNPIKQTPRWEDTLSSKLILPGKDLLDIAASLLITGSRRSTMAAELGTQLICKVCLTDKIEIIFLPCSHFVCCTACAAAWTYCPMCRGNITATIKPNI